MKDQFNSILIKISLIVILLLNGGIIYGQWEDIGNPGFSDGVAIYNTLKFHNNKPYVAFKDWANGYGVTVKRFNGTNWINIGNPGFSNEVGTFLDFVFHNGEPYVAFDDNDNSSPTIMKFNGTNWESLPFPSNNVAYDINLASNNGELYIAYKDFDVQTKITVKRFNGSSWEIIGNQGFSAVGTFWLDFEFYNGAPYVAYKEGYDGVDGGYKATVMKYNGSNWEIVGNRGFSSGQITYSDLAFYQDQPCIAFRDESTSGQRLAVMRYNGSEWINISNQDFINDYASAPDLEVYNGELYVLYTTGGLGNSFARLKKYNGTNWENFDGDLVTSSVVFNVDLNFMDNEIYVAMEDWGNSRKLTVKKQALPTLNIDNPDISRTDIATIYPNPTSDILNIKTDKEAKIFIYDSSGKKVFSSLVDNRSHINISSLQKGIYFLKLIQDDKIINKKVTKE